MVSKPNLSLEAYQILASMPLLFAAISLVLFFCAQIVALILLPIKTGWAQKVVCAMNSIYQSITTAVFGPPQGVINFEPAKNISSHATYIGTRKVKMLTHVLLAAFGFGVIINIAIMFWNIFLLIESHTCDESIDCFAKVIDVSNESTNIPTAYATYTPVHNCSLEDESLEIICYEFTFSLGTGLAAAGGLFIALQIITKIISVSALKVYTCIPYKKFKGISSHAIIHIITLLLVIAGSIVSIVFYLRSLSTPKILSSTFQFAAVLITVCFGFAIPWYNLTKDVEEAQNDNDTESAMEERPPVPPDQPNGTNYGATIGATDRGLKININS